jgi:hypothetical protein
MTTAQAFQTLLDYVTTGPRIGIGVGILLVVLCVLLAYDGAHIRAGR